MPSVLQRLRERKLFHWALAYLAGAWLVFQGIEVLAEPWNVSGAIQRAIHVLLAIGFLVTLVLAWYHGERGRQRVSGIELLILVGILVIAGAAVALVRGPQGRAAGEPPEASSEVVSEKSIAVLPFTNMSADPDNEYFSDGITETIITHLSKLADLKVISRTSVMQYKQTDKNLRVIAKELGVTTILEGSVQRAEDRVQITAQLIDAETDDHLWAEQYNRQLSDIFAIQSDVARQIAAALKAALSDAELSQIEERPTENLEAYDYYLRGLEYRRRGPREESNLRGAAQMFERAIKLDPKFALAYAWLSDIHSQMYHWYHDRTEERMALAREAADSAFAIVPGSPEAHRALGLYHYRMLDYDRAMEQLELAQRSLPNEAGLPRIIGWVKRRQGDFEAARTYAQRAFELDPRSINSAHDVAQANMYLRNYAEAERSYELYLSLAPISQVAYSAKAWLYLGWKGSTAQARSTLSEGSEMMASAPERLWPRTSVWLELFDGNYEAALEKLASWRGDAFDEQQRFVPRSLLHAEILRLKGDVGSARPDYDSARAELERRVRDDPQDARVHSSLGVAYAGLGRIEEAIREGKLAVDLLPFATDALLGQYRLTDLARIYTMVGEYDAAIDQLEILLERPSLMSVALLRIDPTWDALGDHPRFQALLQREQ